MTERQHVVNFPDDGIDSAVAGFIADVLELAGLFRRVADEIARAEGQTQARWYALSVFSGDALTVSQAARRLGTSRQAVQRSVDELLAQELVAARPNPDHRTAPLIELSAAGEAVLARISRAAAGSRQGWMPEPDLDRLTVAHGVLRELRDALRELG